MNKERILAFADFIEKLPHHRRINKRDLGFCMDDFTECGLPLCLGGWSCWEALGRPENVDEAIFYTEAQNGGFGGRVYSAIGGTWLGISSDEASGLFFPDGIEKPRREITPAEAAKVLRNFVETGIVDWTIINGNM